MHYRKVFHSGSSIVVSLPAEILEQVNIKDGDEVSLQVIDNDFIKIENVNIVEELKRMNRTKKKTPLF